MQMRIRTETEKDFQAIHNLVETAFQTAKVSDGREQDFVLQLRVSGNYIPELALVLEDGGEIIGHIMLTRTQIETVSGIVESLLLGPVAIKLEKRNRGYGGKLIRESLKRAKKMGFRSVVLVGDPDFYCQFGFVETAQRDILNTNGIPDRYVQICELVPDSLTGVRGKILFETAGQDV